MTKDEEQRLNKLLDAAEAEAAMKAACFRVVESAARAALVQAANAPRRVRKEEREAFARKLARLAQEISELRGNA